MWEFLIHLLVPIGEFLAGLWIEDERREARQVTLGCALILVFLLVVIGIVVWIW